VDPAALKLSTGATIDKVDARGIWHADDHLARWFGHPAGPDSLPNIGKIKNILNRGDSKELQRTIVMPKSWFRLLLLRVSAVKMVCLLKMYVSFPCFTFS